MQLTKLVRLRSILNESEIRPQSALAQNQKVQTHELLRSEIIPNYREASTLADQNPERFPTTLDASIRVPNPGQDEQVIYTNERFTIIRCSKVRVREVHCLPGAWSKKTIDQNLIEEFIITRHNWYRIHVTQDTRILMSKSATSPAEFFGPGTHERFIEGGKYQVKLDSGEVSRVTSLSISIPDLQASEYVDLRRYAGYRLVSASGTLHRIQTSFVEAPLAQPSASPLSGRSPIIRRRFFEYLARPTSAPVLYQQTTDHWTGKVQLPPGEYDLRKPRATKENPTKTLQLFPSGAVKLKDGGNSLVLSPRIDQSFRGSIHAISDTASEVIFHPTTNTVIERNMDETSAVTTLVSRLTLDHRRG